MDLRFSPQAIEYWEIERLIPSARNARTHSPEQIAEIAGSIKTFGMMSVILVDPEGEIIAGHGRVLAARKLDLTKLPVIVISHLSERDRRAYAIADNKIALNAGWNDELLQVELDALKTEGIDLSILGFTDEDLQELADQLRPELCFEKEDSVPEAPAVAMSRPGDIWVMGDHKFICGDALDEKVYRALLEDEIADMVFGDAPYNVAYKSSCAPDGIANDNLGENFPPFLDKALANMMRHNQGAFYLCMSSSELHTLYSAFTKAGGHWSTFIIWGKDLFTLGRSDYQRQFEPILYGWREGSKHFWCGERNQGDLWLFDKPRVNDLHPTMKPVALVERAVKNSSRPGDIVLDPFAGSGTTLIACEKSNRKGRLIELDPIYCDVTVKRWQEITGNIATLQSTGQSFAEVSDERLIGMPVEGEAL
jgi:DNA modification methylase